MQNKLCGLRNGRLCMNLEIDECHDDVMIWKRERTSSFYVSQGIKSNYTSTAERSVTWLTDVIPFMVLNLPENAP